MRLSKHFRENPFLRSIAFMGRFDSLQDSLKSLHLIINYEKDEDKIIIDATFYRFKVAADNFKEIFSMLVFEDQKVKITSIPKLAKAMLNYGIIKNEKLWDDLLQDKEFIMYVSLPQALDGIYKRIKKEYFLEMVDVYENIVNKLDGKWYE